jgi:Tol biopolymer transport system component
VSREQLQSRLWHGTTFVDFEHGLNAAVNKLRQALNDEAERPRYIETVPGQGYRFIATVTGAALRPVLEMPSPTVEPPLPEPLPPAIPAATGFRWGWAALALLVVAGTGYWLGARPAPPAALPVVQFSVSPPDGFILEAGSSRQTFELSPDGTRLAFMASDAGSIARAWVRDLSSVNLTSVADTAGAHALFWGLDERWLFLGVRGKLRRTTLESDAFQSLGDLTFSMFSGAQMSPEEVLLESSFVTSSTQLSAAVPAIPRPIPELYRWPQLLPDGKHILYIKFDPQTGRFRAHTALRGQPSSAMPLVDTDSKVRYMPSVLHPGQGYLVYVLSGNLLAQGFDPESNQLQGDPIPVAAKIQSFASGNADFSVSGGGTLAYQPLLSRSQLVWVNRSGQQTGTLGPANGNVKYARISPDGRKIATSVFSPERGRNDIWIYDSQSGSNRRLVPGPGFVDGPVWSGDSSQLAYFRGHGSAPDLVIRGVADEDTEHQFRVEGFEIPTDWSPDSRYVVITNTGFAQIANDAVGDLWILDRTAGHQPVPLTQTPHHEAMGAFSPDGKWLAFTSDESGRTEVYLQAFISGEPAKLKGERFVASSQGAICIRWRSDGKELFYLASDGWVYSVPVRWTSRPEFGKAARLFQISLAARFALHSILSFDVSADGQKFIIPVVTSPENPAITVIKNWESLAKR